MTAGEESDDDLVRRFKRGDIEAFETFVRRHQDRIFRLASVWLYEDQLAPDATQEVFLRAFKGLGSFRFAAAPSTWLFRTARNVCREFNRKPRAEQIDDELRDNAANPERQTKRQQTAQQVRELVADLPRRQAEVVMLRVFEDMSVRETARAMGCREGTVKALLHKAMNALREKMNPKESMA